jgi:hypothetical protein
MGWNHEVVPGHEGYIVGQLRDDSLWKEIDPPQDFRDEFPVHVVQAACACGWRSARYRAPAGTTWGPRCIDIRPTASGLRAEEGLRRLWLYHADGIAEPTKLDAIAELGEPIF